jgi:hypothetical protein
LDDEGREFTTHEGRTRNDLGLSFATANRGADSFYG